MGAGEGKGEAARGEEAQEIDSSAGPMTAKAKTEMETAAFFKKPDATSIVPDEFFKRGLLKRGPPFSCKII